MASSRSQLDKLKKAESQKATKPAESDSFYKRNLPLPARVFMETLTKNPEERKANPITIEDLTAEQRRQLLDVIARSKARGSRGDVQYEDYTKAEAPIENTLGRFRYIEMPDRSVRVVDTYDFYNPERKRNVEFYEQANPVTRALTSGTAAVEELFRGRFNPTGAAAVIGEAYIGRQGRPVDITLPPEEEPVKRAEGSPDTGEMAEQMTVGTRPTDQGESKADKTANQMLRAVSEGVRGFLGLEAIEPGSEAYRTGQALANMPGVGVAAGAIKGSKKLTDLEQFVANKLGSAQAKRLQQAADEIPGLEDQYSAEALLRTLRGGKGAPYQGMVTLDPKDFEKFASPLNEPLTKSSAENIEKLQWVLRDKKGFDEVPMLIMDKEGNFLPMVTGHEGRHRSRALAAEGAPKTLVEIVPRRSLEFPGPGMENRTGQDWRDLLNKTLDERDRYVRAETKSRLNPDVELLREQLDKLTKQANPDWEKISRLENELEQWRKSKDYVVQDPMRVQKLPRVYKNGGEVLSFIKNSGKRR